MVLAAFHKSRPPRRFQIIDIGCRGRWYGHDEYFGPPDKLNGIVDGRTTETWNVYNMLKLTRTLFALDPSPKYAEFQERALFNHILASIDPEDGRTCYMVPVGRGVTHEYQDMLRDFTCCVGTGMESHALHGTNWFSFDVPVAPSHAMALVVTYYSDEWRKRTFDILVEGQKVGEQVVEKKGVPHFFEVEYAIPAALVKAKQKVTVRFQATDGNEIAAVFGVRMIRADAGR